MKLLVYEYLPNMCHNDEFVNFMKYISELSTKAYTICARNVKNLYHTYVNFYPLYK